MVINTNTYIMTWDEKVAAIRKHHEPTFEYLGIPNAYFIPRYLNKENNATLWFESELKKGDDLYTEIVADKELTVIPGKRDLYKIKHNPHWREEYQRVVISMKTYIIIPIDQYQKIIIKPEHITEEKLSRVFDEPISKLTILDVYAMLQNKPVSKKNWLNETIQANQI